MNAKQLLALTFTLITLATHHNTHAAAEAQEAVASVFATSNSR